MATEIKCELECGHSIVWGESPETPGASLPRMGGYAFCPECEADTEIAECNPGQVAVESEDLPDGTLTRQNRLSTFYDCGTGTWGYCVGGINRDGIYSETDDQMGFESRSEAAEAGRIADEEQRKADADVAEDYADAQAAIAEEALGAEHRYHQDPVPGCPLCAGRFQSSSAG